MIGVLVMAYGGPSSLEEIPGYLADIRAGRPTPGRVVEEITENYRAIGGRSPLLEVTRRQVDALQEALGDEYRCYLGMRHWSPYGSPEASTRSGRLCAVKTTCTPSRSSFGQRPRPSATRFANASTRPGASW